MNDRRAAWLHGPSDPVPGRFAVPFSVLIGSLLTLAPIIAPVPLLPPFGLLMLIAWRLRRPDALRVWAALPLGLFDDLVSGQPLGSAMLLWTLALVALDVLETRLVWRTFMLDWLIAAGAVTLCLIGGRLVATRLTTPVDLPLLLQIVAGIALFPLAAAMCSLIDRRLAAGR